MNLIFITLDGARLDRIKKSKIIEKATKKGTYFTNVISYAPYTIAAMHAIFSGEFGFNTGVNSYWATYNFQNEKYKTLTRYLKDYGFRTFGDAINKLILPIDGFDELLYHNEDKDDLLNRHVSLLDKMKTLQSGGEKFFLYLHYSNIHTNIKHNVLKKFDNFSPEYFKDKSENDKNYDKYFEGAELYLESILNYCNEINLLDDTALVLISDHGISVGEKLGERAYGVFCYDYTITTFALFIKKGVFPKMEVSQQVRSIDIMPTILDFLKIEPDPKFKKISGETLMPLVNGKKDERLAIIESGNPLKSNKPPEEPNVIAIRKNGWKLILNLHNDTRELYNLSDDHEEKFNLHGKQKQVEKVLFEELKKIHPIYEKFKK